MNLFNRLQLRNKLLLLGVAPAATLAFILAAYLTSTRLNDMYELLHKTNENLSISIAESSINSVFSGNFDSLDNIVKAAIKEPDVTSIQITNKWGTVLAQASNNITRPTLLTLPPKRITQAIKLKSINQSDDFDNLLVSPQQENNEIIGYVILTLSYNSIQQRQQDILLNTIFITLLLLFIIGLIAKYISGLISRPILQLTSDVKSISQGNYTPPPTTNTDPDNKDEVSTLAHGIADMARQINDHQQIQEQKILEATQELRLQNDKLFSAQAEIFKSAEAKSRFISHISHEIRTPLNGIIGFLEIIQQTQLDSNQIKLVNASYSSSKNLHTIINEVLDFAQIEAGKIIINKTNFNPKDTIQDALLLLSSQAQDNGVTLEYQQQEEVPKTIHQDRVKFGQILINLLGNAIKFTHHAKVIVRLGLNPKKQNTLEITVIDQGIGISKHNLKQLFQEYSQLDNDTREQGSGLGLVITKQIVDALHGSIIVESALGKGSTFTVSLPFTPVKDDNTIANIEAPNIESLPDLSTLSILVADDNEFNRLLLTHLLERQHANVICVNDGQQAVDLAQRQRFDLLLLDLKMPVKLGSEALLEIRSQANNLNYKTPAIAITAHITSGEERAHHISSFDGYLIKPIEQQKFFQLVEQLINEYDYDTQPFISPNKNYDSQLSSKPFVYELAKRSMNADPLFMSIMLEKFFSELPKYEASISKFIKQGDYKEAAAIVHKTHGSASYCGTPSLKLSAKLLEDALTSSEKLQVHKVHMRFCRDIKTLLALKTDIFILLSKESPNDN
jgi:two-component system sensor histidine kinase BarA